MDPCSYCFLVFVAGDRRQSIMSPYITPQGGENIAVATVQKYKSQIHNFQKEVDSVSEFVHIKLKMLTLTFSAHKIYIVGKKCLVLAQKVLGMSYAPYFSR